MGVTRAQAVYTFIKAVEPTEISIPEFKGLFMDVPSDYWAAPYIEKAIERRLISVPDGQKDHFFPEEPITRAEAVTMMVKLLNLLKD